MANKSFTVKTADDYDEKPAYWDDHDRVKAWWAPFHRRETNAVNYDNKLAYWKRNVAFYCETTKRVEFSAHDLKQFFTRFNKIPNVFDVVFPSLYKDGVIRKTSEFQTDKGLISWAISATTSWVWNKWSGDVSLEFENDTPFIHMEYIKKFSRHLLTYARNHPSKLYNFKELAGNFEEEFYYLDEASVYYLIRWLCSEGKAVIYEPDRKMVFKERLVKFAADDDVKPSVSESDTSRYYLPKYEALVTKEMNELEDKMESLSKEALTLSKNGKKASALNALRKKKQLQKRVEQLSHQVENIRHMQDALETNQFNVSVVHSYAIGSKAMREDANLEGVEQMMENLKASFEAHGDVQDLLGATLGPADVTANDADYEDELRELMAEDAPAVPKTAINIKGKMRDFEDEILEERLTNLRKRLDS